MTLMNFVREKKLEGLVDRLNKPTKACTMEIGPEKIKLMTNLSFISELWLQVSNSKEFQMPWSHHI